MSIVLYNDNNFGGRTTEIGTEVANLSIGHVSGNDTTSSVRIKETPWLLYTDADYQGRVSILDPGEYANSDKMGIPNDALSSLRPFPSPSTASILLFQDIDFRGRMVHVTGPMADLTLIDFNDKVSSAIVLSGTWLLFRDVTFSGESFTLGPGRHPRVSRNDVLSSVKPI